MKYVQPGDLGYHHDTHKYQGPRGGGSTFFPVVKGEGQHSPGVLFDSVSFGLNSCTILLKMYCPVNKNELS